MKKILLITILSCIVLIIIYCSQNDTFKGVKELPKMCLKEILIEKNLCLSIDKSSNVLVANIDLSCSDCKKEIDILLKNQSKLKDFKIYFISNDETQRYSQFAEQFQGYAPSLKTFFLLDSNKSFPTNFKTGFIQVYPNFYLFGRNGELLKNEQRIEKLFEK